jgi:hypothetical protein
MAGNAAINMRAASGVRETHPKDCAFLGGELCKAIFRHLDLDPDISDALGAAHAALPSKFPSVLYRSWESESALDARERVLTAICLLSEPGPPPLAGELFLQHGNAPGRLCAMGDGHYSIIHLPLSRGYAFAVPSEESLEAIAALAMPVLEMGTGSGYWASLLQARGVQVEPRGLNPPDAACSNTYFCRQFTRVRKGDERLAADARYADHALLLVWPYSRADAALDTSEPGPWDARAVEHFTGRVVVHVGSLPGAQGEAGVSRAAPGRESLAVMSSTALARALRAHFVLERTVETPDWPLCADELTIWRRL